MLLVPPIASRRLAICIVARVTASPPNRVTAAPRWHTLLVDLTKSDLMLESEIRRLRRAIGRSATRGRQQFVVTPASLAAAYRQGTTMDHGPSGSYAEDRTAPPRHFAFSPRASDALGALRSWSSKWIRGVADGLTTSGTAGLIHRRLGETALGVLRNARHWLRLWGVWESELGNS